MSNHKIHKYKLVNLQRDKKKEPYLVYKCMLPGCSHYLRLDLADNREALCNKCNSIFVLARNVIYSNGRHTPTVKPICAACKDPNRGYARTKGVKAIPVENKEVVDKSIDDLMNSILPKELM